MAAVVFVFVKILQKRSVVVQIPDFASGAKKLWKTTSSLARGMNQPRKDQAMNTTTNDNYNGDDDYKFWIVMITILNSDANIIVKHNKFIASNMITIAMAILLFSQIGQDMMKSVGKTIFDNYIGHYNDNCNQNDNFNRNDNFN